MEVRPIPGRYKKGYGTLRLCRLKVHLLVTTFETLSFIRIALWYRRFKNCQMGIQSQSLKPSNTALLYPSKKTAKIPHTPATCSVIQKFIYSETPRKVRKTILIAITSAVHASLLVSLWRSRKPWGGRCIPSPLFVFTHVKWAFLQS
jgi:hypothetical protein